MSSYDTVIISCVECDKLNTIQSKAGKCKMKKYNQTYVPMVIAADILLLGGEGFECTHCKFKNFIGGNHPTHTSIFAYKESNTNVE